jgi:hypothetical protein
MRVIFVPCISAFLMVRGVSQVQTLSVIKGTVRDCVTGQPIGNANVFGSYIIYPQFRPLAVESGIDTLAWRKHRSKTYEGGFQHFLRALVGGNIESEDIVVYGGDSLRSTAGSRHTRVPMRNSVGNPPRLGCGALDIWRLAQSRPDGEINSLASCISLEEFGGFIDYQGMLDNPLSIMLLGRGVQERVANTLPLNE